MEINENTVNTTPETSVIPTPTVKKTRVRKAVKPAVKPSRIVTAVLEQRNMRIVFRSGSKTVHTSRTFKTRNTVAKVVAFARGLAKGAAAGANAVAQVTTDGKKWATVTE